MSNTRESVSVFVLGGALGRAEFADYLASLDANLTRAEPFVMVVDGTAPELGVAEIPNRRWQTTRAVAIGRFLRGIAFVTGTMTRERVRALYALQPQGVPYAFFTEMSEALAWAERALDSEGRRAVGQRKTRPLMSVVN